MRCSLFLVLFSLIAPLSVSAKVLVITHSYQRPDFIELQHKTFQKFLKDDYEFVVFNDGKNRHKRNEIEMVCRNNGIRTVRIPQSIHRRAYLSRLPGEAYDHPCITCANVVQYSLNNLAFDHNDYVMIIDSDMFLLEPFSVREFMRNTDLAGFKQSRGKALYLWNGIVIFDMPHLPDRRSINFNCGRVEGAPCDAGGHTHYYLKQHPNLRLKTFKNAITGQFIKGSRKNLHPLMQVMVDRKIGNSEFFHNFTFFHYRGGGNWDYRSPEYHEKKTAALHELIRVAMSR